jgi:hypothetical protein
VKKILPFLVLVGACTPDIAQTPPPAEAIIAQFDPGAASPIVPKPNDLAARTGKIVVPSSPTDTPAQAEFDSQYLGSLAAFPFESTASAAFSGPLDPASLIGNVLVVDITDTDAPKLVGAAVPALNEANDGVEIPPPAGGWTRAHHYAVILKGGDGGLRGAQEQPVIGSPTWALVASTSPLVSCPNGDLQSPACVPAVDVIPSEETDPTARLKDQAAKAAQLEQLRLAYAPLLEGLSALNIDRTTIPLLWTFTIVDAGEVTFDPANATVPFPNDVLRNPTTNRVTMPNIATGKPVSGADCAAAKDLSTQLTCGLNTLDGFSTLVAPISETSATAGAVAQANLDPKALGGGAVNLVPLKSGAPAAEQTAPKFTPCIGCLSSKDASGAPHAGPQQLQWRLDAPLDEKTTYLAYVTTDAKDDQGKPVVANPVFALTRSKATLLTAEGHSAVNILTDDQAKQLEPLRAAMAPALDGLEANGVPRGKLALAFVFTTQSEVSVLDQLASLPKKAAAFGLPDYPLTVQDVTAQYQAAADNAPALAGYKFFAGAFLTPVLVTGTAGTFNPDPTKAKIAPVQFVMSVPPAGDPPTPHQVTIFGHGFEGSRNDFLPFAAAAGAKGQIVIAADTLFHGDRSSCTGAGAILAVAMPGATDDAACLPAGPAASKCDGGSPIGLCVLKDDANRATCTPGSGGDLACFGQGQGLCAADGKCQGAGARLLQGKDLDPSKSTKPVISGWNIFSLTNFFATRDNFRQQVIDLSQLVAVLKGTNADKSLALQLKAANGGAAVDVDTTKINYVGQSLGGILGTLFNAVSPDVNNVVLNVPGGALPSIILNAPAFAPQKAVLLKTLEAQGIKPGTPQFDQFLGIVQWILDPADPANMAWRLTHGVDAGSGLAPNVNRKAFIQFIQDDQTVPNVSNFALVAAASRSFDPTKPPGLGCQSPLFCYEFTDAVDGFDATSVPLPKRHGFLLTKPSEDPAIVAKTTGKAQQQAATFLSTGALP